MLSLRFAMVHDVIHERYPRHAPAHFIARADKVGEELKGAIPPARRFASSTTSPPDSTTPATPPPRPHPGRQAGRAGGARQAGGRDPRRLALLLASAKAADEKALRDALTHARAAAALRPVSPFGSEKWLAAFIEYRLALRPDPAMAGRYAWSATSWRRTATARAATP